MIDGHCAGEVDDSAFGGTVGGGVGSSLRRQPDPMFMMDPLSPRHFTCFADSRSSMAQGHAENLIVGIPTAKPDSVGPGEHRSARRTCCPSPAACNTDGLARRGHGVDAKLGACLPIPVVLMRAAPYVVVQNCPYLHLHSDAGYLG